jgi:tetratricopeptide (TPR) repeat protein
MTPLARNRTISSRVFAALPLLVSLVGLAGCGQIDALRGTPPSPVLTRAAERLQKKDHAGAVQEFDKAIAADRNNIDVYIAVMAMCARAGKVDLVAQYGEMANAATSKAPADKRSEVLRLTGDAYLRMASSGDAASRAVNTAKAVEFNEAAFKLRPNDASFMNNLGYAYAEHYDLNMPGASKLQEALRLTRTAVTEARKAGVSDKDLGIFVDSLGWVYYKLQNYDEAVANLSRAAHLAPDLKEIHVHLAQALYAKGRVDEAIVVMEKALKLDPNYTVAAEQLKKWKESRPPVTSGSASTGDKTPTTQPSAGSQAVMRPAP